MCLSQFQLCLLPTQLGTETSRTGAERLLVAVASELPYPVGKPTVGAPPNMASSDIAKNILSRTVSVSRQQKWHTSRPETQAT